MGFSVIIYMVVLEVIQDMVDMAGTVVTPVTDMVAHRMVTAMDMDLVTVGEIDHHTDMV